MTIKQKVNILFIITALIFILAVAYKGSLNVRYCGAKGDGITDDTRAIQNAINYSYHKGGGTVFIPDGVYLVNPDVSIALRNKVKLKLSGNATLKALPTDKGNYSILLISDVNNAEVVGGNILGERYEHAGSTGEWGMGINIIGSNNIYIADVSVSDCWGDGIYIGVTPKQNYCENIKIQNFKIHNNRRQGISIISVKNLTIRDGVISTTHGTDPQSGIDLEPDYSTEFLQNIVIENLNTKNNKGYGITSHFVPGLPFGSVSITIKNHKDVGSADDLGNISKYINAGYNISVK